MAARTGTATQEAECSNSSIIPPASSYRDVYDFLSKHTLQKTATTGKKPHTNTRIGDEKSNIHGGTYNIPDAEYPVFLELYYRDVLRPDKKEYLTEKQRDTDGPIVIDLDFRHDYEVDERQYTKEHIDDLLDAYLDEFKKMYQLDDSTRFPVFILEKPSVNRLHDQKKTKDGIHIIIGLQADRVTQQILRQSILKQVPTIWKDLPLTNSWEDVFDAGISKGTVGWQLYGSRKPNHERYKLTHVYDISFDPSDQMFQTDEIPVKKFDLEKNLHLLSVRHKDHLSLFMKNEFLIRYEEFKRANRIGDGPAAGGAVVSASRAANREAQLETMMEDLSKIRSKEDLDMVLNYFLDSLTDNPGEYDLKTVYDYVMILPETYYGEGSYEKWLKVGWALRNTSKKLLIVWMAFSAQSKTFNYREQIPDLCNRWAAFDKRKEDGVTKRSIFYWAMTDAREEYDRVRRDTLDYHVENTIHAAGSSKFKCGDRTGCGDFDLANVLYQMYKDQYVCVSVKNNMWYQFKDNRWTEIDSGTTLRKAISVHMRELYNRKTVGLMNVIAGDNGEPAMDEPHNALTQAEPIDEKSKNRSIRILNICQRLSSTNDKKNIMTESKELFYDGTFLGKLDTNPNLLCFKNGVIDFAKKEFRRGHPEDNVSMCTGYDYVPLNPAIHQPIMDTITEFMDQLFPERELCDYMWDHLASTLIGTTVNQTFNMYIGIGSNGKSVLVDLMSKVLGEYKGDVPLTLVTDKRGKIGGLAPEIVQLKGKRYAVMQEPSKTDVINEGVMKQLTSGKDPIQGRAPYMPQTISFYPQFKLVVTCNALMGVNANDHGTWRRIRAVPFKSLFTDTPVEGDKEKPYQFLLDKYIDEKFEEWKQVFAAMLVQRAFISNGVVKDCSIVLAKSNEYRQSQDYISEFINDRVVRCVGGQIKKMELNNEFKFWHGANYGGRFPGPKDLFEYMNKEFGRQQNQVWVGVRINYGDGEGAPNMFTPTNSDQGSVDIRVDDL